MRLSTQDLPPSDRLPYLLDHFGRHMHKVVWQPAADRDPLGVFADCSYAMSPHAVALRLQWTGGTVERTSAIAETEMGDSIYVYRELQQDVWYEMHGGVTHRTVPGSLITYSSELSYYKGGTGPNRDYDCHVAALPLAAFKPYGSTGRLGSVRHLTADGAYNAMVSNYFLDWCRSMPQLSDEQAAASTEALVKLLVVSFGALDGREEGARAALAHARVRAAERFVAASLHRPELTPGLVAVHLGISVRQLHLDFEPTGTSIARRILELRIERCRKMLATDPGVSVTEIALSCGFEGLSTFYRTFKAATGFTATEYRDEMLRQSGMAGRQHPDDK